MNEIESLPSETRGTLGQIWADRARSELGAGSGFEQVIEGLEEIGAHSDVIALAKRAAIEEVEHADSCRALAELYLGKPVPMPPRKRVGMPAHAGAPDAMRSNLHVIGLCCFNETIAAEFVAACLDASEAPAVRASTSTHLRDEIGHARVGWAHLGSGALDAADRRKLSVWLPRLVRANGSLWLDRVRTLPVDGVSGHGYPPVATLEAAVRRAMSNLVIEGLRTAGFDVDRSVCEASAL